MYSETGGVGREVEAARVVFCSLLTGVSTTTAVKGVPCWSCFDGRIVVVDCRVGSKSVGPLISTNKVDCCRL